ncbi:hypothetical protein GYMLUDRAFT_237222 [Collybiopsis luxurians FD-317 M1]|nr:hypothetical protein GYMLUDRAFT_237222 [Collybiopsis luxurians FD-317 M1]
MSPEDHKLISSYATSVYINTMSEVVVLITGYGVSVLGMLIAIYILLTKSRTRPQITLLAYLIVEFIVLTWSITTSEAFILIQEQLNFIGIKAGVQEGLETQGLRANKKALPLNNMDSWALTLSGILSDLIVIWRAWVLFQPERLWKVALVLLMGINIGVNVTDCILHDIISATLSNSDSVLDWLSLVISSVVNMFATGLIAWKAWNYHHIMKEAARRRRTRVESILLLLIESGAIYCAIQTLYAVFILLNIYGPTRSVGFQEAYAIFGAIFVLASGWYPIAVVILVNINSSPVLETLHIIQTMEGSHGEGSHREGSHREGSHREGYITNMIVHSDSGRAPSE